MPVPFRDAPLTKDKTRPSSSRFRPFGLGVADPFPADKAVDPLSPAAGPELRVNYLRTRARLGSPRLCLLTPPRRAAPPHK